MDMFDDAFGSAPATTAAQPDPAADFINREKVSKMFWRWKYWIFCQADLGDLGMDFGVTSAPSPAPAMGIEGDGTSSFFVGKIMTQYLLFSYNLGIKHQWQLRHDEWTGRHDRLGNARLYKFCNIWQFCNARLWYHEWHFRTCWFHTPRNVRYWQLKQKAKKELESFYKNYEEEVELTKKENRIAEEAFLADVNGLKPGTEWERVCRNSNFNSKVIHNKKDRTRMRNVLLQLKQTPLMNRE
jgi:hypothetical protein